MAAEAEGVRVVVEELESPDQQKPALTTSSSSITGKAKPSTFSGAVGVSKNAQKAKVKKELRDQFLKDHPEEEVHQTEDETRERTEKIKRAKEFMMQTACTDERNNFRSLRTGPKELGEYGVGIQLYFEFLSDMGWIWMFLFLFSCPMLYYSLGGTILEDFPELKEQNIFYKLMSVFTPANLGTCGSNAQDCLTEEQLQHRKVLPGTAQELSEVTPALGILDFVQMLIALFFIVWFRIYKIPAAVRIQDEANITASDFAIRVAGLPRKLTDEDHPHYEDLLKQHFEKVLTMECGVENAVDQVAEVALIREYDGCISTFLQQGNLLEEMHEAGVSARLAKKSGKDKDAVKHTKRREKLKQKILSLEALLENQADMKDQDREVCGAFVMFETEELKDAVVNVYKPFSNSWTSRLVQPKYLRFRNRRIDVNFTCEPEELYWENMDYSWLLHKLRKFSTLSVSFLIVIFCIFILTYLRSGTSAVDTSSRPFDLWIFEKANQARSVESGPPPCMEMCQLDVFTDEWCEDSALTALGAIVDTSTIWNALVQTMPHLLQDQNLDCGPGDPVYQSSACGGGGGGVSQLAFTMTEALAVKCVRGAPKQEQRGQDPRPNPMKVYGCPLNTVVANSSGWFSADGSVWEKDKYCLRFDDVIMQGYDRLEPVKLRSDCLFPIEFQAAERAVAAGETFQKSPRISCFCTQQAAEDTLLRIPGYLDTPAAKICEDWAWYQGTQMGIRAGGVVAVMVINNILLLVFAYLDSLGRYQTATALASSQVFNLFFATLVNTAIVYNLIGMNFYTSTTNVLGQLRFGRGQFDDLTPLWFITIGNMLVITIVCQAACSVVLPVMWIWTVDPLLRWFFCRDTHTQELLNEYHIFPEWTLSLRVAETLVIVFGVFMYSSGFPVLYLCGAFYCLCAYWGDKYTLLRGSRRPPGYTKSAIESAIIMMPFAILFHCVFGLWLFGNQDLFPSSWGGLKGFVENVIGIGYAYYEDVMQVVSKGGFDVRGNNYGSYLQARMVDTSRAAAEPLLWIFFMLVLYYGLVILHSLFRPCLGNSVGNAMEWTLKALKIIKDAEVTKISLSEAKEREDQKGLLSYRMDANPNYEEAMLALKFDPDAGAPGKPQVEKARTSMSFSRMEEHLERKVATGMHAFENYVAGAIDRLRVFGRRDDKQDKYKSKESVANLESGVQGRTVI